ncbi:MAG: Lrp/AsnC ligand binding domain-containing protein [Methanocellales archaeon]
MVVGVTMIKVVLGQEKNVYQELRRVEGVRDVFHIFGKYDFVAIIEVEGLSKLNYIVDKIREIEGVTSTQTIIGAEI